MNNFFYLFDDDDEIVDQVEKSNRITSFYPDVHLSGKSKSKDWMESIGIFAPIKFVLLRLVYCYVVTQDDDLFVYKDGIWRELTLPFKDGSEEIVQISATYCHVVLLIQNKISCRTRVFVCGMDSAAFSYSEQSKIHKGIEIPHDLLRFDSSGSKSNQVSKDWYEILFKTSLLEFEEVFNYISCASGTLTCLTSNGRIFSGGSNRFGEAANNQTFGNSTRLALCEFDESNPTKDPHFVKAVHGDHNIIALTKDGKVFYCGSRLGKRGDLPILKEFSQEMKGEYFIDVAATYYGIALLTNKFNIYTINNEVEIPIPIKKKLGPIRSAKLFASSREFFLVINNETIYQIEDIKPTTAVIIPSFIHKCVSNENSSNHSLTVSSEFLDVFYWKKENIFKRMNNQFMIRNLKDRSKDGKYGDVEFQ